MSSCIVIGAGLAGLSCASALASSGFRVQVLEAKPYPGGRASSYRIPGSAVDSDPIDNCQHILLRCCVNLLDFYRRLGVDSWIRFHREFYFLEPGGRLSTLSAGRLPAPFHLAGSFAKIPFLTTADKIAIGRAMLALKRERVRRNDLDSITMLDWLQEKRQPPAAIRRFWEPVLVSAVNEQLDRMAATHGFKVMWLGFLATNFGHEMGIPVVRLADLYNIDAWKRRPNAELCFRTPVDSVSVQDNSVTGLSVAGGGRLSADYYVSAVPFEQVAKLIPQLSVDLPKWEHSPIVGIHLWFDRPVTDLPHAVLLDRTIQWFFNKDAGRYLQVVVSASRSLVKKDRVAVTDLVLHELGEFLPRVREAELKRSRVIKEVRATFSARPGLESIRPAAETPLRNLFLAGDWTRSGWPATMEGAVRSGYAAAESITGAAGIPQRFLLPDVA